MNEEWFSDVDAVRRATGLLEEPLPNTPRKSSKVRRPASTLCFAGGRQTGGRQARGALACLILKLQPPDTLPFPATPPAPHSTPAVPHLL